MTPCHIFISREVYERDCLWSAALPCAAGSLISFTHRLLHWGSAADPHSGNHTPTPHHSQHKHPPTTAEHHR